MKRTGSEIFVVAVIWLFISGLFTLAVADDRKENPPTTRSNSSSISEPASGVSSSPQPSLKPSVKPPEKLPGTEPINKKVPNTISTPPPQTKIVLNGFCCKDGTLAPSNNADCSKKRGAFYTDKRKALAGCIGFCCKNGELQKTTKEACIKKVRGKFFVDKKLAVNNCQGWCCDDFNVSLMSTQQCTSIKGKFFGAKPEADRFCNTQKGWCCVDGETLRLTKSQCAQKKGGFSASQSQANLACRSARQPTSSDRLKSSTAKQSSRIAIGTTLKPIPPDLEITRTWLNRNCVMQVDIKNNGGPIAVQHFNQARMNMSAGPKNTLPHAKSYLKYADPQKKLLTPGGAVTFNTGLVISGSAQSLAWVDTDHHIQESNEINNGDDQFLNCPKLTGTGTLQSVTKGLMEGKGDLSLRKSNKKDIVKPPNPPPPPPNPSPNGDQPAPGIMMESAVQGAAVEANLQGIIDLAITDISLTNYSQELSSVRLGKTFSYIVTIKNIGVRNQSEDSSVAYFQLALSDNPYVNYHRHLIAPFSMALPPLRAGEEHTISNSITIPRVLQNNPIHAGMYKFDGIINTSGYRPDEEANTGNNHFTKIFKVRDPKPADLAVKSLTLTPDCRLRVTLKNEGASIDHEDFVLSHLRVEKGEEVYSGNSPDPFINEVYDQVGLKKADPNGRLKKTGFFVLPTTYIWPAASTTSSNWSIDLGPGESAVYTVKVDPYNAIYDDNRENNTKTMNLTCPH